MRAPLKTGSVAYSEDTDDSFEIRYQIVMLIAPAPSVPGRIVRRRIGTYIWIAYLAAWALMVFILPRFFPQIGAYPFFIPFFFFFPMLGRRRGRGPTQSRRTPPGDENSGTGRSADSSEYGYDSMLAEGYEGSSGSRRPYILYAIGAAIFIAGLVLVLTHYL